MPYYSISYQRQVEAEGAYAQITPDLVGCEDPREAVAYARHCLTHSDLPQESKATRVVVVEDALEYSPGACVRRTPGVGGIFPTPCS